MNYHERIVRDQRIVGGEPVFKGTRVTLRTVLASLAEGAATAEILADFPTQGRMRDYCWCVSHSLVGMPWLHAYRTCSPCLGADTTAQPGRDALVARIAMLFATEPIEEWRGCLVAATDHKMRVKHPG